MTNKPMFSVERKLLEIVTDNRYINKESISIRRWEALCKLRSILSKQSEQHQGEAVAICRLWNEGGSGERTSVEFIGEPCADGTLLYAEQPAPVAVVLPERKTKADYSGYIEQFQSEAAGLYNSALDDVAILNGGYCDK